MITKVCGGIEISRRVLPFDSMGSVTSTSRAEDWISSGRSMSKCSSERSSSGLVSRFSFLATSVSVVPCVSRETIVQRNTTLKIISAYGTPCDLHKIAKMIGTAPFSPTQLSISLSRWWYCLNGSIQSHTANGREIKTITILMIRHGSHT